MSRHELAFVSVKVNFDIKWKIGACTLKRRRQKISGMHITHRCEDFRHLGMEREIGLDRGFCSDLRKAMPQETQPSHRVPRIHGGFQWEMSIEALQEHDCLVHDKSAMARF